MDKYDLIIVGTGFSGSMFLSKYLERFGSSKKILILDRGEMTSHKKMMDTGDWTTVDLDSLYINKSPRKQWALKPSFGGNSNYWIANTPRFFPSDFQTKTLFGVGTDWPIRYEELEQDYSEAEYLIVIAGPDSLAKKSWRSKPYPQPAHILSDPDKLMIKAAPEHFFPMPTARASQPTMHRAKCCATTDCMYCPVDAKFRVGNELMHLYESGNVELKTRAQVKALDFKNDIVDGVNYIQDGKEYVARGETVVLAANAVFNSSIMLRSGYQHPYLGKGLMDHPTYYCTVLFDGLENYQGGSRETGIGFQLFTEKQRSQYAGCSIETSNVPALRPEWGRWREVTRLEIIFEDIPRMENCVEWDKKSDLPIVTYTRHSDYTQKGRDMLPKNLEEFLAPWPVEKIYLDDEPVPSGAAHIMGTHRMGLDPSTSVVDSGLVHHQYRNLFMLGGGAFVSPSAVNPSLTMSALSLRAARLM